jgi:hypothetical protein
MPIATQMASVNMRLEPGAVRELHWHKTGEVSVHCGSKRCHHILKPAYQSGPTYLKAKFRFPLLTRMVRTTSAPS